TRHPRVRGQGADTATPVRLPSRTGVTGFGGCGSGLQTEAAGRTGPLAAGPQPAQALDEHRVVRQGGRVVDQGVEHLVVARRAHVEELLDRRLLGAGVLPPLPLEGDDLA